MAVTNTTDMEDKKRVLIVTQEMEPYTEGTLISTIANLLPVDAHEKGLEVRVLMPRFGPINERRHRLHEVVRLSGMNIIVDEDDYPLIIKVASLPNARLQVYFLDNDEFFKRKTFFTDDDGAPYEDNTDRMVFFCKGVLETVKKFGWAPDIIHCHGWMTSLVPAYLKTAYQTDPIFQNSKIIYSHYGSNAEEFKAGDNFFLKASINNMEESVLAAYQNGTGVNLEKGAIAFSDAIINVSGNDDTDFQGKPTMQHEVTDPVSVANYLEFYESLVETSTP
jgi:starch synthase